ncbi:tonB-system energizer ExbB [Acinetobacter seifertii]|uniref:tonB-system energizer ExbB n=1 Tax=Acinetobacter seifertii TaxID=1530123 RepID=UPI001C0DD175|nr:tonB-system energizer ExbB [Acinetobacter seifertii]MBU3085433.1 tonB-system energizer ExbB [Acinetobacter seifertii]
MQNLRQVFLLISLLSCTNLSYAAPPQTVISLSPLVLFQHADIIVKTIIILLVLASILSWIVWFGKNFELGKQRRFLLESTKNIVSITHITQTTQLSDFAANQIFQVAQNEFKNIEHQSIVIDSAVKERAIARIERITETEKQRLSMGVSILATIGAIAPFVGLFGTVWGIMHSFVSIAQSNVTNLSVVAPGIAEALFATALGLFAAIPSVILYNHIVRLINQHTLLLANFSTAVLCLLSSNIDQLHRNQILKSTSTIIKSHAG